MVIKKRHLVPNPSLTPHEKERLWALIKKARALAERDRKRTGIELDPVAMIRRERERAE